MSSICRYLHLCVCAICRCQRNVRKIRSQSQQPTIVPKVSPLPTRSFPFWPLSMRGRFISGSSGCEIQLPSSCDHLNKSVCHRTGCKPISDAMIWEKWEMWRIWIHHQTACQEGSSLVYKFNLSNGPSCLISHIHLHHSEVPSWYLAVLLPPITQHARQDDPKGLCHPFVPTCPARKDRRYHGI